ncbi:hypothetical protein pdam_00023142 [Pocillopora damicornis]|uniref:Uncharacterized protein n=1 Tax=Pocillopora damicornis TaxID=46731 RepID=A0A3M6TIB1_POCDA|nr:hypothetical protein pdam_00023142 [Pocillopora damicornis]
MKQDSKCCVLEKSIDALRLLEVYDHFMYDNIKRTFVGKYNGVKLFIEPGDKPIPSVQSGQEVELEANENYSRVEGLDLGPPTTPGS